MSDYLLASLIHAEFLRDVRQVNRQSRTIPHYTPHDISHIQGVEESISDLLAMQENKDQAPRPLEQLLLSFCAWSHDLGMIEHVALDFAEKHQSHTRGEKQATPETLRRFHDLASAYYLQKRAPELLRDVLESMQPNRGPAHDPEKGKAYYRPIIQLEAEKFNLLDGHDVDNDIKHFLESLQNSNHQNQLFAGTSNLVHTVNLISRYHRRSENLIDCPRERRLFDEPIRARFLAAIFRLADALHIDRTRFSEAGFDLSRALPQFGEENRMHWIKSAIISSIRIDKNRNTVHIQADLPDESDSESGAREMLNFVRNDVEEDLLSVSGILLEYGFPALLGVSHEVHYIPEIDYASEIRSALDSILAAASPNTSKLASIAIESINHILESTKKESLEDRESFIENRLEGQIRDIDKQLRERPCHEALRKIRDLLLSLFAIWMEKKRALASAFSSVNMDSSSLIWTWLECAAYTFSKQREKIRVFKFGKESENLLDDYSDIVIYGYSRQVIQLLKFHFERQKNKRQDIHVLECRTKTLYSHSGNLLYLDGLRFAEKIAKEVGHTGELSIEPDMALGHIIDKATSAKYVDEDHPERQGRVAILMGTNAVYSDGTFRHSMGHLAVAAIAKSEDWVSHCDVIVVTDSMKIGNNPIPSSRERNPGAWLTPDREVLRRLGKQGIKLHNWQEDMIAAKYIDKLIILDLNKVVEIANYTPPELNKVIRNNSFNARVAFCSNLDHKMLAAIIRRNPQKFSPFIQKIVDLLGEKVEGKVEDIANWILAGTYLHQDDIDTFLGEYERQLDPPTYQRLKIVAEENLEDIVSVTENTWKTGVNSCAKLIEEVRRDVEIRNVEDDLRLIRQKTIHLLG